MAYEKDAARIVDLLYELSCIVDKHTPSSPRTSLSFKESDIDYRTGYLDIGSIRVTVPVHMGMVIREHPKLLHVKQSDHYTQFSI